MALIKLIFVLKPFQFLKFISGTERAPSSLLGGEKKGKIIRNWADGVNFQSCVWESSIQIPLTNNSQKSRLLLTGLWKQVCISPVSLALMCPWCCPGSFWAGWHLHNTLGSNMPLHLEQSSLSTDRNRNTSSIEGRLCVHHLCSWIWLREGTEIICKEIYIIIYKEKIFCFFFTVGLLKHWNSFPREVYGALSTLV